MNRTRLVRVLLAAAGVYDSGRCRCGHARDAHEHYRPGRECSVCFQTDPGPTPCIRYRPNWRAAWRTPR